MSQNVKKIYILGYLGGPEGIFNDQTGHILLSSYQIRKQSDKKFLSLNPKYEKNILLLVKIYFSYLGGPGGPLSQTQVNENYRAVRPHHRADICITREKNNCQFFIYMGHNIKMFCIFAYSGGLGGRYIIEPGPSCFPGIL